MKRYCRNCYHPLPYRAKFCAHCGQKDTDGRVGMRSLMVRLWNNTFHLEGKFISTAWQLFVPGMMTVEFFKGKQDRYPHPIRLFAIVMFLFLFLLNTILKQEETNSGSWFSDREPDIEVDSIMPGDNAAVEQRFSLSFYERMKYRTILYDMRLDYDSLPRDWKTPQTRAAVDSLLKSFAGRYRLGQPGTLDSLKEIGLDSISFGAFNNMRFATLDVVRYEPNEIIQRYKIEHWLDRLVVRQTLKSYKNPEAFAHASVGSLTWAILALVAVMSGILALLYYRQKRYYVEHFIFLLHFHIGVMLLLFVALLGLLLELWGGEVVALAAFLPMPGMYLGMRRYYGQSRLKTFVKWLLYGICYLFAFILLFVLGLAVVFAVF